MTALRQRTSTDHDMTYLAKYDSLLNELLGGTGA